MGEHWFWLLVTLAVLAWYSCTTIYVGIRGMLDIKHMLRSLEQQQGAKGPSAATNKPGEPLT